MSSSLRLNRSPSAVLINMLLAALSLFFNGFGIYLTIQANIGAAPWDVLNLGLSKTLCILYGNASIAVSVTVLILDILLREPIGLSMFINAFLVGKSVDFFNRLNPVPTCRSLAFSIPVLLAGLIVIAYTQYGYMLASLGCGPRDSLMVGLAKRCRHLPIGFVSILLQGMATFIGWLLGGPVGIGTILCVCLAGPIMQLAFQSVRFDATQIRHQSVQESFRVLFPRLSHSKSNTER